MVQAATQSASQDPNTRYKRKKRVRRVKVIRGDYTTAEALIDPHSTDMMDSMFSRERPNLPPSLEQTQELNVKRVAVASPLNESGKQSAANSGVTTPQRERSRRRRTKTALG